MQRLVGASRRCVPVRPSGLTAAVSTSWASSTTSPCPLDSRRHYASAKPLPSPSRMKVADLLEVSKQFRSKQTNYIHEDQTLDEAVKYLAQNENSATLVVVNTQHQVVGLITNRLALQRVMRMRSTGKRSDWNMKVSEVAIPARKVLHVSPEDSLEDCRAVMALSGVGELPVLQGSKLLGTVSLTDIASLIHRHDAQLNPDPTSAKSDYINLILPRKGLPANTLLDQTVVKHATTHPNYWTYYLHSFGMSIPHPQKKDTGGEDAFFLGVVPHGVEEGGASAPVLEDRPIDIDPSIPTVTHGTQGPVDVLAMGVADGVGSWFEKGVSARQYAEELMVAAHQAVQISYAKDHDIEPSEVLHAAWSTVLQREIVGSSTACVLALDPELGELHGVNLGDSGFLIIRDKTSDLETARLRGTLDGSLMRKIINRDHDLTPAGRRKGAHVTYRSPQQLHYFNCPFQLGFAGAELVSDVVDDLAKGTHSPMKEKPLFETPENGMRLRVPVLEGDLIILATDGLFDNVDEDVLLEIVRAEPDLETMCRKLVRKAYELSLDRSKDSPFARLAKENDLLWGGGIPDDITIITARVSKHKTTEEKNAEAAAVAAVIEAHL
ncbi:Stage II sporulation protein E (SpoIIE) [Phytophthora infestans]|uniref:Protein phosphatase n=1 Tax=Phytophthora infestans TaxID=4787 RepID=A0A833VWP0_PHYIN|nr:Stage II sporulation protein E (SpoIIE) [Phytophthora infestans]